MSQNLAEKIIAGHLVSGEMVPGKRIGLNIDQILTQDATGTMVYLQFEAIGINRIKVPLMVSYVDHNTLQAGPENAEDHRYLQTAASKYGAMFCRPAAGICHQVQLERFAAPGMTLIGSDSHTPNAGAVGSLAFGSGGLEIAATMAGRPYFLPMPKVVEVVLSGSPAKWICGKDIVLELLRRLSVKGGVGRVFEFSGTGLAHLGISDRAAICNQGVELGATSLIFPADERTRAYFEKQGRAGQFKALSADPGAKYDDRIEIDISSLEPMIARPSSPDNVVPVRSEAGTPVRQVCVGGCCNSSVEDLTIVAKMLEGKKVHPDVSLTVSPGSKQVLSMVEKSGVLGKLVRSGARILETACGPCIGMGQSPARGAVSIRTMNRNFPSRSGTIGDKVYLASPYTAAAAALTGRIVHPGDLGMSQPVVGEPEKYELDDTILLKPSAEGIAVNVERGPNIIPLPPFDRLPDGISGEVLIVVGDNITTDGILPGDAKALPFRSNIPKISEFTFCKIDPTFHERAKKAGGGFIVAGQNYGQGSSREHAAIVVRYFGIRVVFAKSFARIHRSNLIAQGVIPLVVEDEKFHSMLEMGARIVIHGAVESIRNGSNLKIEIPEKGISHECALSLEKDEREIILAGGLLNKIRADLAGC